ncbi:MAG: arginine--tRNA ligase [Paracoccaceae bacterium]|nr:arginine--tRNA ligase [Paracoccaceae bacterium]
MAAQARAVHDDPRSLVPPVDAPQTFLLDYGGANLAKDMHVGHLRAAIVGQALNALMSFAGHKTISDVHLGDWGLQLGQLISQIADVRPELLSGDAEASFTMDDLQVWYPTASARSKEDEAFRERARHATAELQAGNPVYMRLWQQISDVSSRSLQRDYGRLGVYFDQWYGESRYQSMLDGIVEELLADGTAVVDDGAVVIHLPEEMKLPPLMVRNSNGGFGYGATDLATIKDRVTIDDPDTILYVVDARQKMHFRQVFQAAEQCGYLDGTGVEHIAFGTVNGTDGKPFKTREGGVMRLHDLMETMKGAARARLDEGGSVADALRDGVAEQIAIAAIKFGELNHDRESNYVFDMDQFLRFEGKTGPYIQYTCVRIGSLFAKAEEAGFTPGEITDLGDGGRDLILCLSDLPQQVARAVEQRKPSVLANHAYRLANATNTFYQANRILGGDASDAARQSYLTLLQAAIRQLTVCLDILGIAIPEQM